MIEMKGCGVLVTYRSLLNLAENIKKETRLIKTMMVKRFLRFAVLISCVVCFMQANASGQTQSKEGTSTEQQVEDLKGQLRGTWQKEETEGCLCGRCLKIQFDKLDDDFCVESNQIYIVVYYEFDAAAKSVNIYFEEPTDLGMGGASLPWKRFDKKKPIAVMDISGLNKGRVHVKWIGFTEADNPRKKYTFGKEYQGGYRKVESIAKR